MTSIYDVLFPPLSKILIAEFLLLVATFHKPTKPTKITLIPRPQFCWDPIHPSPLQCWMEARKWGFALHNSKVQYTTAGPNYYFYCTFVSAIMDLLIHITASSTEEPLFTTNVTVLFYQDNTDNCLKIKVKCWLSKSASLCCTETTLASKLIILKFIFYQPLLYSIWLQDMIATSPPQTKRTRNIFISSCVSGAFTWWWTSNNMYSRNLSRFFIAILLNHMEE